MADIPDRMLAAYRNATRMIGREVPDCRGLTWAVLAGVAKVESNHAAGRRISPSGDIRPRIYGVVLNGSGAGGNTTAFTDTDGGKWDGLPEAERAVGPFQFLPSTWETAGRDGNHDRRADPHNADDAALGAGVYLCGKGRNLSSRAQLRSAILQYNHSTTYLTDVLGWIDQYAAASTKPFAIGDVSSRVRTVLDAALAQRGMPYSWGGGNASGPTTGTVSPSGKSGVNIKGFDCSGLTTYAFARVGVRLPRTAAAQAGVGLRIPASAGTAQLRPGDLVFYALVPGQDASIHHVGIYLGHGQMINAPRPGTVVRIDPVLAMSGYAGGARVL
ncbi:C40 family peptidase [Streptomyces sp. NPDC002952]|uniref:C40 family peptidase n=1 Tax=Streptomyces sp. NPDC002952 TaxID=3364673 RepID=UPI0036B04B61